MTGSDTPQDKSDAGSQPGSSKGEMPELLPQWFQSLRNAGVAFLECAGLINWCPFLACVVASFSFIAACAIVFAGSNLIHPDRLTVAGVPWIDATPTEDPNLSKIVYSLKESAARTIMMVFALFQTIAFVCAMIIFTLSIHRSFQPEKKSTENGAAEGAKGGLGVAFVWIVVVLIAAFIGFLGAIGLFDGLAITGFSYSSRLLILAREKAGGRWLAPATVVENGMAAIVIGLGAFAVGALCKEPVGFCKPDTADVREAQAKMLGEKVAKLRRLLTVSAVVLVISVMQVSAHYRWPISILKEKAAARPVEQSWLAHLLSARNEPPVDSLPFAEAAMTHASLTALAIGGLLSLYMTAVFGTGFLLLHHLVQKNMEGRDDNEQKLLSNRGFRKKHGLDIGLGMISGDVGKILGPIIVAGIAGILKF